LADAEVWDDYAFDDSGRYKLLFVREKVHTQSYGDQIEKLALRMNEAQTSVQRVAIRSEFESLLESNLEVFFDEKEEHKAPVSLVGTVHILIMYFL